MEDRYASYEFSKPSASASVSMVRGTKAFAFLQRDIFFTEKAIWCTGMHGWVTMLGVMSVDGAYGIRSPEASYFAATATIWRCVFTTV